MCGIVGLIDFARRNKREDLLSQIAASANALHHRGPDDAGAWCDPEYGVVLGHRRLSILDLSPTGHQPMSSESGRFIIVFNGEIYNFAELKTILLDRRHSFSGTSDTEVLLAAVEEWGLAEALVRCCGMFALALWDREDKTLALARDRAGEKPLYFGFSGDHLFFASELKAIQNHPEFEPRLDRLSLALYMRYSYVPAPRSIFANIQKLSPGHWIKFPPHLPQACQVNSAPYWSLESTISQPSLAAAATEPEVIEQLDRTLRQVIRQQMVADVPVGVFLSGGIDSSLVTAIMQQESSTAVNSFSIGFHEPAYNEAHHARAVAASLGTHHTELYVRADDALALIPELPQIYDEPFADASQIPTFLVARLARKHVTVCLSGDGGDELFGGYNRYYWVSIMARIPAPVRRLMARLIYLLGPQSWDRLYHCLPSRILPKALRVSGPGDKFHKLARIFSRPEATALHLYQALISNMGGTLDLVHQVQEVPEWPAALPPVKMGGDFREWMMFYDFLTYLPDDILTKVDRATMANSLESRIPFLDRRVIDLAWHLPMHYKIREGKTKWILRQLLYRYVDRSLIERPKAGFGLPIDLWLRGPLKDWAEELLSESTLSRQGLLHTALIRRRWQEHLSGGRNWQALLWNVLMFQAWLQRQKRWHL